MRKGKPGVKKRRGAQVWAFSLFYSLFVNQFRRCLVALLLFLALYTNTNTTTTTARIPSHTAILRQRLDSWLDSTANGIPRFSASNSHSPMMDAPTLQPKFLKNGSDLGIVAVGFSGGQVR